LLASKFAVAILRKISNWFKFLFTYMLRKVYSITTKRVAKMKYILRIRQFIVIFLICALSSVSLAQGNPGASDALVKKARDHLNLFQYDHALVLLKQATQLEPDKWEPFYLAGNALLRQKKPAEA